MTNLIINFTQIKTGKDWLSPLENLFEAFELIQQPAAVLHHLQEQC